MSTSAIVTLVVVIVVLAVAVLVVWPMVRRRRLQQKFGPEYERTVAGHESRAAAERELMEREKRHSKLELRPLSPESRERYAQQWIEVQSRFVDAPEGAVVEADQLVTALMGERGYPTEGDHEQRAADLSVEHATTLEHYRSGHLARQAADQGEASTEQLREAMVHYRVIFVELLDLDDDSDRRDHRRDGAYQTRDDAYETGDGAHETRDGAYEARDGAYQTRDGAYEARDGAYQTRDGAYEAQDRAYETRDGATNEARDGEYAGRDGAYVDREDTAEPAETTRRRTAR